MSDKTPNIATTRKERGTVAPATKPTNGTVTQARFDAIPHGDKLKYGYGCKCDACYEAYMTNVRITNTAKTACVKWMKANRPMIYRRIVEEATNKRTLPKIGKGTQVVPIDEVLRTTMGVGKVTKTRTNNSEVYVEWSESPLNLAGWIAMTQVANVEA
jgi:hypothetical protein